MLITPDGDDGNENDEYDLNADGNEGSATARGGGGGYGDDQKEESDAQVADSTLFINQEMTNASMVRPRSIASKWSFVSRSGRRKSNTITHMKYRLYF